AHTVPTGICNPNQAGAERGNGRADIDSRTTGTGAVAAIAVAAAAPAESPHRSPAHNRGGHNPMREPVSSATSAPPPACAGTRHRTGIRGMMKLEPTSTVASRSARDRLNVLPCISFQVRRRLLIV